MAAISIFKRLASLALTLTILGLGIRTVRLCDRLYYYPERVLRDDLPATAGLDAEDISIPTADGLSLPGWRLPARGARRGVVLHLHGNAANRANHWPLVAFLPPHGYDVIEFDYRGYGGAPGRPSRDGLRLDAEAALRFASDRAESAPIILFGQSLGAVLALVLAATHADRVQGVIAEAAFVSHRAIAADVLAGVVVAVPVARALAWLLVSRGCDPADVLDQVRGPVLVVHGSRDDVVPPAHSQAIAQRLRGRGELVIVEGGHHLDLCSHARYRERVIEFLERCTRSRDDRH